MPRLISFRERRAIPCMEPGCSLLTDRITLCAKCGVFEIGYCPTHDLFPHSGHDGSRANREVHVHRDTCAHAHDFSKGKCSCGRSTPPENPEMDSNP